MRLYFTQKKNFEAYYCWRWLMEHRPDLIVNQKELAVIPLGLVAELTARSRLGDAKRLLLSIEYHRYRQTDAGRLLTAYLDSRLAELEPPGETREFQIRSVRRTLEHVLRSDNLRMIGEFIEHNVKSLETAGISVLGGIREWMQYHQNQRRLAKSLEQVLRPDPHFGWSEPARKIQQEMQRRCDPNWRNLEKAVEHARTEMSRVLKRGESRQQLLEKINRVESIAKELRQVEERKLNLQKSCGMADMSVTRLRRLAASLRDESALHESRGAIDVSFVYNEIIAKIEELISYD